MKARLSCSLFMLLWANVCGANHLSCADLNGAVVFSQESPPVYLGFFGNEFASESINNAFGNYGSAFSSSSVRNEFSNYGSPFSAYSATNTFSNTPPVIYQSGVPIAFLTTNTFLSSEGYSLELIDASCSFTGSSPSANLPSAPTNVSASDGQYDDRVELSWNAASGASSYNVYFSTTPTSTLQFVASTTSTSMTIVGGAPGQTFYFWVLPVNSAGEGVGASDSGFVGGSVPPTDTDGDGIEDASDNCANIANSNQLNTDNDSFGDACDSDDDGDGVPDSGDAFPLDSTETTDSDGDGVGDIADAFPLDATETADTDGDGIGDNADAFPLDATETADTDGDGIGDTADLDDDNDGMPDSFEIQNGLDPLVDDATADPDADGVSNLDEYLNGTHPQVSSPTLPGSYPGLPDLISTINNPMTLSTSIKVVLGLGETLSVDDSVSFELANAVFAAVSSADLVVSGLSGTSFALVSGGSGQNYALFRTQGASTGAGETIEFTPGGLTVSTLGPVLLETTVNSFVGGIVTTLSGTPINAPIFDTSVSGPTQPTDTDGDGVGDNADAFPLDATETADTDGDGVGDNADAFPLDATESLDTDGDGIGDNQDLDNTGSYLGRAYHMTASTSPNLSEVHIINTSDSAATFTGTLFHKSGSQLGESNIALHEGLIEPEGRLILFSTDLEQRFNELPWTGPAILDVRSSSQFEVMTKLSRSGRVTNTNCVRTSNVHNLEGTDAPDVSYVRFINDGVTALANIRGTLYDSDGNPVGQQNVQFFESLGPREAVFLSRDSISNVVGATWTGVASLELSAPYENLKLMNLNFVNDETFFNFSCYVKAM